MAHVKLSRTRTKAPSGVSTTPRWLPWSTTSRFPSSSRATPAGSYSWPSPRRHEVQTVAQVEAQQAVPPRPRRTLARIHPRRGRGGSMPPHRGCDAPRRSRRGSPPRGRPVHPRPRGCPRDRRRARPDRSGARGQGRARRLPASVSTSRTAVARRDHARPCSSPGSATGAGSKNASMPPRSRRQRRSMRRTRPLRRCWLSGASGSMRIRTSSRAARMDR